MMPRPREIEINVPVAADAIGDECLPRHLNVRLSGKHAEMFQMIFAALQTGSYRLADGKHVDRPGHVVPWLMDQMLDKCN